MIVKIYSLSSSDKPEEIRYIGKTKDKLNRRLSGHLSAAKKYALDNNTKNHNYNWINSVVNSGNKIIMTLVDEVYFEDDEDWKWLEEYWISQFKSWGFKLTNLTTGGDGNQNQKFSKESIEKRANKIRGVPRDEETRRKISESNKGKPKTKEHRENVRKAITKLQGKPVLQFTLEGDFVKEWSCVAEAARFYGVDQTSMRRAANGQFKKSAGFVWKYKNEELV